MRAITGGVDACSKAVASDESTERVQYARRSAIWPIILAEMIINTCVSRPDQDRSTVYKMDWISYSLETGQLTQTSRLSHSHLLYDADIATVMNSASLYFGIVIINII